jgi:hypothetical protein
VNVVAIIARADPDQGTPENTRSHIATQKAKNPVSEPNWTSQVGIISPSPSAAADLSICQKFQTVNFLFDPFAAHSLAHFFAFSPSSLFEPANFMPKSIARLRTPAAVRFSRKAIAAEFSPDAASARS